MNNTENKTQIINFTTKGTCSRKIKIEILEDKIINAKFIGGCPGNLEGIEKLIEGMKINEVIEKLQGIKCGDKPTSCPDQLALCLNQHKLKVEHTVNT